VTFLRQWPSLIVLLYLGLMPAGEARCFAADPPPAQAPAPAAPQKAEPEPVVPGSPAKTSDVAAPAPQNVAPESAVDEADEDEDDAAAAQKVAPEAAKPAAKNRSLLGAIVEALGGNARDGNNQQQAAEDQNIRNQEAQFRPQFEQVLYIELAFMRRACKPDAKPFAEVAKAAKADLRVPLREYVVKMNAPGPANAGGANAVDPRAAMQKLLLPLVKEKLGPAKADVYRQECEKRSEARKHAVVVNLVAALDERLVLTAPQRAKLVESLSANYENPWDQCFEMFAFNNQNDLPAIRDASIVPFLDEQQKSVWGKTTKQNYGQVFFGQITRDPFGGESAEIQEIAHLAEEARNDK
jgi:hypothetical protein